MEDVLLIRILATRTANGRRRNDDEGPRIQYVQGLFFARSCPASGLHMQHVCTEWVNLPSTPVDASFEHLQYSAF